MSCSARASSATARSKAACLSTNTSANRALTLFENIVIGQKLSEYHTGFRAYRRRVLEAISYHHNSDDFIFDNQVLVQAHALGFRIAELTCPTKYFAEASSINLRHSLRYGILCCATAVQYRLHRMGVRPSLLFQRRVLQ